MEQAEAVLVAHYARLVRLAYLVLPPSLGRHRRVLAAHGLTQRALPRGRVSTASVPLPGPRAAGVPGWARPDPVYAWLRLRVLRGVLAAERPRRFGLPLRRRLPGLPWAAGLRLVPRTGGTDELVLDHALSEVSAGARAVYVLRGLEGMADRDIRRLLRELRLPDPEAAFRAADGVAGPPGSRDGWLWESPEFDACVLQARPTDLLRRSQHRRAAAAAAVAVVACGGMLGMPAGSWDPEGAAKPPYARNPAAERALDPDALVRAKPTAWHHASRTDFSVWPARGELRRDEDLLRRALAVWARPGDEVRVSAVRGTAAGPPPGPPQLLYAGRVGGAAVVLLYDGLRVARYVEPLDGGAAEERDVSLSLARTDGAGAAASGALVVAREGGNVRYLTAPWTERAAVVDLLTPSDTEGRTLRRGRDGVTGPVASPDTNPRRCDNWPGLSLTSGSGIAVEPQLYTDLGELTPVRLTDGRGDAGRAATGAEARARLARTACHFPAVLASGVKSVNSWEYARQRLPEGDGEAAWVCTRAETWRGGGARVVTQFQPPTRAPGRPGAATARAEGSSACGQREKGAVLSGVLWKSRKGDWYVLAAADDGVVRMRARGKGIEGGTATSESHTLAVPARPGTRAELSGERDDGTRVLPPR